VGKVSASITLNRSIEEVFDFLNDQRNHANLNRHNFREFKILTPNSTGAGARSQFLLKTGAFEERVQLRVTTSKPYHLLVEEGHLKGGTFHLSWRLTPVSPSQTHLVLVTEYQPSGPAAFFEGVIQKAFVRIYTRVLTDLAQKLAAPA